MSQDDEKTERVRKEAREWLGFIHSGEVADEARANFEAWLAADPMHRSEYRHAEEIWRDLTAVEALAEAELSPSSHPPIGAWIQRPFAPALAAALLLIVAAPIGWFSYQSLRPETGVYFTTVGVIEEVALSDGSTIALGGRSRIETGFSRKERRVELAVGEAFFTVEEDLDRPFIVVAEDTEIRVTGTAFNVRRGDRDVRIAVSEGAVAVSVNESGGAGEGGNALTLTAGQQVASSAGGLSAVEAFDTATAGAWRSGRLVYNNAKLGRIIEDVRRYYPKPIVLNDENLKSLTITTAFRTDQVDQVLAVLEASHPIDVSEGPSGAITLAPRDSK